MSLACGAEELGLGCDVMDFEGTNRNVSSRNSRQGILWPGDQLAFSKENDLLDDID